MFTPPRVELIPLPQDQVSFQIDGKEVTRWHFGADATRPFFYPLSGPRGVSLTRMGHPGAENHDHHRSVWFAHAKLLGIDFWSENTEARIRQQRWFVYDDGADEARMAVELGWFDGHDPQPLVIQELIAILRPLKNGEYTLDLQSTFRPQAEVIEFQQSNFGFLAVRVAKSLSVHFGDGIITGDGGRTGEPELFGQPARWIDYSGPVALPKTGKERETVTEGITCFDHPANHGYPNKWHVREDGWMGLSVCRDEGLVTSRDKPLRYRFMLHVHSDPIVPERAEALAAEWARRPFLAVRKSTQPHRQFELYEVSTGA